MKNHTHPSVMDAGLRAGAPGTPGSEDAILWAPGSYLHLARRILTEFCDTGGGVHLLLEVRDPLILRKGFR